jgi:hypothetical protein
VDLFLQHRPSQVTRGAPVLRVVEASRLLLHEEPDPARVSRLTDVLGRDGILRNPPVVAPMPEDRAVVLDGANRVTALRALGIPHVVAQVVPYEQPEITLSTWRHFVREDSLRDRIVALPGTRVRQVRSIGDAETRLARRQGIAAAVDARGIVLLENGDDPIADAGMLNRLVALYRGRSQIYRVDKGDVESLGAEYGPGTLVVFPAFNKEDILVIAARGGRLPAGITRHVIPGRALRVNMPLAWLAGSTGLAEKQAHLDATLQKRWLEHGVRYYAESTYLFDE